MSSISYPFDSTGIASTNFVQNEQHTVNEANYRDYYFIVPIASPFFLDNLKVYLIDNNITTELLEGIGYNLALPFIGASRSIGKMVYGAITLTSSIITGEILISYQTLGGSWVCDQQAVLNVLAEKVYNPRTVTWDEVTNVQETFPPINHTEQYDDIYGQEGVINSLISIADAIALASGNSSNVAHFTDYNNPHQTTALQVGLGLVENLPVVTDAEIIAGEPVRKYVTYDELLKYNPPNNSSGDLDAHIADHNNPHATTATQVGLGLVENLPVVSQATIDAGVPTHEYLTFDRIGNYTAHLTDNTNPHQTTAAQVGLGLVENLPVVTQAESLASTSVHKYVTQDRLLNSILPTLGNLTIANYGAEVITVNLPIITANGYDMAGVSIKVQYRLATSTTWIDSSSTVFVNGQLSYNIDINDLAFATTYQARAFLVDTNNPNLVDISNTLQFTTLYSSLDPDSQFDIVGLTYIVSNVISEGGDIINNVTNVTNPFSNVTSIEITQQLEDPDFDQLVPTVSYLPAQLCVDPSSTLSTLVVKSQDIDVVAGETLTTVENGTLIEYTVNSVSVETIYANRPSNYNICNYAALVDFNNLLIENNIVNYSDNISPYFPQVIISDGVVNFISCVDTVNGTTYPSQISTIDNNGNIIDIHYLSFSNSCYASLKGKDRIYIFGNNYTGYDSSDEVLSTITSETSINDVWYPELNSLPAPIDGGVAYTVGKIACLLTAGLDGLGASQGFLYVSNINSDGSLGPWSDVTSSIPTLPPVASTKYDNSKVFVFETNYFRYCIGGSILINGYYKNNDDIYAQSVSGYAYDTEWSIVSTLTINNENIVDIIVDTTHVYLFTNAGLNSRVYVATINADGTLTSFVLSYTFINIKINAAFVTLSKIYILDNDKVFYSVPYDGWYNSNSAEVNVYTLGLTVI